MDFHPVHITRTAETRWEAVADDRVVGHGDVSYRPDGRLFVSIDVWQDALFDRLVTAVLADLPMTPVHTLVGEHDTALRARWERAGFTLVRREREYVLPTDPAATGLATPPAAAGLEIVRGGEADEARLRLLDRAVRDEVGATVGWRTMPAEVLVLPGGDTLGDPSHYAVAVRDGRYVGHVRVVPVPRRARIGLIAVRADERRRGVGRALLAHALGALHDAGTASAWAEADESNTAAIALLKQAGARQSGACLELART
ncbi:GNAT family N-acetyltransferase [Streptomyces sp. NPDC086023]|uniref:GNAT family N-acetyltransferase n=1 Tax=Streptomyces sp. NPDC086023 TaxID=3365746 RepID=UPI0037D5F32D